MTLAEVFTFQGELERFSKYAHLYKERISLESDIQKILSKILDEEGLMKSDIKAYQKHARKRKELKKKKRSKEKQLENIIEQMQELRRK